MADDRSGSISDVIIVTSIQLQEAHPEKPPSCGANMLKRMVSTESRQS